MEYASWNILYKKKNIMKANPRRSFNFIKLISLNKYSQLWWHQQPRKRLPKPQTAIRIDTIYGNTLQIKANETGNDLHCLNFKKFRSLRLHKANILKQCGFFISARLSKLLKQGSPEAKLWNNDLPESSI